jgi:hypothetical protein
MRLQSLEHRGCNARRSTMAAGMIRVAAVLSAMGLAGAATTSQSAAQQAEVGYVEVMSGQVIAFARGAPVLLQTLDVISDRTRLDLQANSELRICHYRMRKVVRLKGPLRASISASGVTAENGKAIDATLEACAAPVVSTFQGGFVTRAIALTTTNVPLRPSIKVVDRGTKPIRKITLWDDTQQTMVGTFDRNVARPLLDNGKSYLLVIEQSDGGELKMVLQASAATQTGPLIVVVR